MKKIGIFLAIFMCSKSLGMRAFLGSVKKSSVAPEGVTDNLESKLGNLEGRVRSLEAIIFEDTVQVGGRILISCNSFPPGTHWEALNAFLISKTEDEQKSILALETFSILYPGSLVEAKDKNGSRLSETATLGSISNSKKTYQVTKVVTVVDLTRPTGQKEGYFLVYISYTNQADLLEKMQKVKDNRFNVLGVFIMDGKLYFVCNAHEVAESLEAFLKSI